jgi:hypothetical protein
MNILAYLRFLAALFHRSQVADDMEEELRPYIQHRGDDLEGSGLDRSEAERRAGIAFSPRSVPKKTSSWPTSREWRNFTIRVCAITATT